MTQLLKPKITSDTNVDDLDIGSSDLHSGGDSPGAHTQAQGMDAEELSYRDLARFIPYVVHYTNSAPP